MASVACDVCSASDAKYTCPRCNAHYCSLPCYQSHSDKCTEDFYREGFTQELKILTASDDEKRRMEEILLRLHQEDLGGDSDDSESSEEDHDDGGPAGPRLTLEKAQQLIDGDIYLSDLSLEDLAGFKRALEEGQLSGLFQAWSPWWASDAAAELELRPTGTRLVQEAVQDTGAEKEGTAASSASALPNPPSAPIPPLSALTSTPPSPAVPLHLAELLYAYCLVLRLYNGDCSADELEAGETLLAASPVLRGAVAAATGAHSGGPSPASALSECIARVCSVDAGLARVNRGFAVGIVGDVSKLLQLGRSVVITALADLGRLIKAGRREAKGANATDLVADLKKADHKVAYFLSWANEAPPALYAALAAHVETLYQEQKATLDAKQPQQNEIVFRETLIT